ncbi:MAG: hypothetical protein R2851_27170 [Caldilineaceae bacterium]
MAGELPPEELGVRAVDDLTLEIETEGVFPPLPGVMKFAYTAAEEGAGGVWPILQQFRSRLPFPPGRSCWKSLIPATRLCW